MTVENHTTRRESREPDFMVGYFFGMYAGILTALIAAVA